jgi:hypothetical protein
MTDRRASRLIALVLVVGLATPAAAAPPGRPVTVDQLMEVSRLNLQFPSLAALLVDQFQGELGQLGKDDQTLALRVLATTLAPEPLRQAVRAELLRRAHPAHMAAVAEWHRGVIGIRRGAAAAVLHTPAGRQELAAFAAQIRSAPPPPARIALIERLDWTDGGTDDNVAIVVAAARARRLTFNALLPAEGRQRVGAIERQLERARPQVHTKVQQQVWMTLLFISRELSDEEIEQTIAFVGSEPSRWFDRAVREALVLTVTAAAERATRELVRVIPLERWQAPAAASR